MAYRRCLLIYEGKEFEIDDEVSVRDPDGSYIGTIAEIWEHHVILATEKSFLKLESCNIINVTKTKEKI